MKHYSLVVLVAVVLAVVNVSGYEWYTVEESDIISLSQNLVTSTQSTDPTTEGAIIESTITGLGGCNAETHILVIQLDITGMIIHFQNGEKIRYTLQFWDAASCWSILGNIHYGSFITKYGQYFKTGLHEFDITNENDQILSNTLLYGSYHGETVRCDNDDANFWNSDHLPFGDEPCNVLNSCYMGSLRVEQRRDENVDAFKAGIAVGFTCARSHTTVKISEIEVGY